ncbi:MAG: 3'-5' exonuclease, partial [Myxococcales bacterium]
PAVVGVDREGRTLRRAEGKDVVILLRRFSHIDLFRQELLARSIPHVVVKGGGFWGAQEILDLGALLGALADPDDRLAVCAVLRSPLVAVSDSTLALLALEKRLSLDRLERLGLPEGAAEEERARLAEFLRVYAAVRPLMHRLGVAAVLEHVVEELDLEAVLAAGFEGEQKVANVRKLIAWARAERPAGAGAAARALAVLAAQEGREGQASLIEESDPGAVRIMTVHQSKGLEFPVVFVPECGARANFDNDAILFDREEGLCVRPRGEDGETVETSAAAAVQGALRSRQQAELERLFYVAATRARDLLVFSGEIGRKGGAPTWRTFLDRFVAEDPEAEALVQTVAGIVEPARLQSSEVAPPAAAEVPAEVEALVARASAPPKIEVRSLLAPVTQLSDYALCARRHYLGHVIGVEELPRRDPPEEKADKPLGELTASERGSLVHLALERLDFSRPAEPQVRALLQSEGMDPDTEPSREIVGDVVAFADSPLGRRFAKLPPSRLHRELPFVLAVGDGAFTLRLRGTIDVLAVLDDGSALILDYKHTHARGRGAGAYAFQLACYALAVRSFLPKQVGIDTGIAFLKDRGAPPDVQPLTDASLEGFRSSLLAMSREMLERRRTGDYPVLARRRCEALHCGFVYQCHAAPRTAAG